MTKRKPVAMETKKNGNRKTSGNRVGENTNVTCRPVRLHSDPRDRASVPAWSNAAHPIGWHQATPLNLRHQVISLLVGVTSLAIGVGWLMRHPGWAFVTFGVSIILSVLDE